VGNRKEVEFRLIVCTISGNKKKSAVEGPLLFIARRHCNSLGKGAGVLDSRRQSAGSIGREVKLHAAPHKHMKISARVQNKTSQANERYKLSA
jgi:hypothetical protein